MMPLKGTDPVIINTYMISGVTSRYQIVDPFRATRLVTFFGCGQHDFFIFFPSLGWATLVKCGNQVKVPPGQ